MPPISPASIWPPNRSPFSVMPMEAMSTIGNCPLASLPMSITMPSTLPENSRPSIPLMLVTVADKVSWKSAGSAWISRQVMPTSVMWMGSHSGHLKLPPSAEPILRKTPNPGLVTKVPSPRKAKLRPSPPRSNEPIVTSAPTAPKLTSSSLSAAPVSIIKSVAVSVRKEPSVMRRVSALNCSPLTLPSSNSRPTRRASVSGIPEARGGSEIRSVMLAEMGLPGKNLAPPEAIKIVPSKSMAVPKVISKSVTPMRISSSSRILPIFMAGPELGSVSEAPVMSQP